MPARWRARRTAGWPPGSPGLAKVPKTWPSGCAGTRGRVGQHPSAVSRWHRLPTGTRCCSSMTPDGCTCGSRLGRIVPAGVPGTLCRMTAERPGPGRRRSFRKTAWRGARCGASRSSWPMGPGWPAVPMSACRVLTAGHGGHSWTGAAIAAGPGVWPASAWRRTLLRGLGLYSRPCGRRRVACMRSSGPAWAASSEATVPTGAGPGRRPMPQRFPTTTAASLRRVSGTGPWRWCGIPRPGRGGPRGRRCGCRCRPTMGPPGIATLTWRVGRENTVIRLCWPMAPNSLSRGPMRAPASPGGVVRPLPFPLERS